MPRLTNKTYLKQRAHLRHLWFDKDGGGMSRLAGTEQWDLHGYFALAEDLMEVQVLKHRQEVTREQPGLPQRAGRAYVRLQAIEQQLAKMPPRPTPVKGGKRTNRRTKDLNVRVLSRNFHRKVDAVYRFGRRLGGSGTCKVLALSRTTMMAQRHASLLVLANSC